MRRQVTSGVKAGEQGVRFLLLAGKLVRTEHLFFVVLQRRRQMDAHRSSTGAQQVCAADPIHRADRGACDLLLDEVQYLQL